MMDDAIFVDAVQNTIPVPTKSWKFPNPDELDAYVNKITAQNPQALELEGICSNCLGFYLVYFNSLSLSLSFLSLSFLSLSLSFELYSSQLI